ncbi:MAG: geranylgeranyl reductase family protein [Acidobacteriota bacterium]
MLDAIIIGSGPAGSHSAYLLAKMGYHILLIEGRKTPKQSINCSGIIGLEAFREFDLWEVPILNRINKFKFISPSGRSFIYQSDSDLALAVDRSVFDSYLTRRAISAGASFLDESWVRKILTDENEVKVCIQSKGRSLELRAKAGVIAAGYGSSLVEMVGLKSHPRYVEAVQAEVYCSGLDYTEVYLGNKVAPGSFAWLIPLGNERGLVGLTTEKNSFQHLQFLLHKLKAKKNISKVTNLQHSAIPLGLIPKAFTRRILVVGEAAGQVKTTTNGGIYYGMIGAEIASQVLKKAFQQNRFDEETLYQYDQLWRAKLGSEIRLGLTLRDIYSRLSDSRIDMLFNLVSMDGLLPLIKKNLNFDWHKGLILSLISNPLIRRLLSVKLQG